MVIEQPHSSDKPIEPEGGVMTGQAASADITHEPTHSHDHHHHHHTHPQRGDVFIPTPSFSSIVTSAKRENIERDLEDQALLSVKHAAAQPDHNVDTDGPADGDQNVNIPEWDDDDDDADRNSILRRPRWRRPATLW